MRRGFTRRGWGLSTACAVGDNRSFFLSTFSRKRHSRAIRPPRRSFHLVCLPSGRIQQDYSNIFSQDKNRFPRIAGQPEVMQHRKAKLLSHILTAKVWLFFSLNFVIIQFHGHSDRSRSLDGASLRLDRVPKEMLVDLTCPPKTRPG